MKTVLIYFHLDQAGLTSLITAINLFKFSANLSLPKDNFPKTE
jgi:hypothetical protein